MSIVFWTGHFATDGASRRSGETAHSQTPLGEPVTTQTIAEVFVTGKAVLKKCRTGGLYSTIA
ncbi:MAG: hypothetical protein H6632_15935 [Anaerolineales bacterium]|nr:hypothetical protein [Anaerolineales bacterium]